MSEEALYCFEDEDTETCSRARQMTLETDVSVANAGEPLRLIARASAQTC
jgi:hypothetical protein